MNATNVNTFFVAEKISKVRWVPEKLKECERFVTGTADMPCNNVSLWRLYQNQYADNYNQNVPRCSAKIRFNRDITGLEIIGDDRVAVSCADGRISILKIKRAVVEDTLELMERSPLLHKFDEEGILAPCTAISVYGREMASVGEDGRLNIIDPAALGVPRCTLKADSCALMAVAYVNQQEVLTANRMGVIRVFDIRASAEQTSTASFMTSCEDDKDSNYVSSLASHPTQPYVVLAGSEEGSITVWDLRNPGYPASYLSVHSSAITEIAFHRTQPSKLFTATEGGDFWLWSQKQDLSIPNSMRTQIEELTNPWLNGERTQRRVNVISLISDLNKSINSFDSYGSKLICGSDNEAVYIVDNIL